jgi:pSer/pThr/pTyr-binding forkhead associated (FHA) protein
MPEVIAPHAKLLLKSKDAAMQEIDITKPTFTIGRKPDNDLVLDDPAISGHHARILKIQAAYFLEDLKSTNGTLLNSKAVDRRQLQDADVIAIGHARLVFRDQSAVPLQAQSSGEMGAMDLDKTMVLTGKAHRGPAAACPAAKVKVLSGRTDQAEYHLTKLVTVIGSQEDATIRLTGWFAPKVAAMIARRKETWTLIASNHGKKVLLNQTQVMTQVELKDGDQIDLAGVSLRILITSRKAA